ncbi:glycoside hydrolase family 25 protein [Rhodococcus sp. IEGM 1409]|uniref:glycoside hydrolase family 25 protein n=1 Tax=Rhodococcus TaxID=1827 RepID=UPI000A06257D|nr:MULTISPECIES: glycoside hydrolase family 25 protein [Rhodococcus]MDZ7914120.1 glycoside hydrolase family 25 protein [Rhodococcus sp. (in: high G+C Gram-positive bacteria)]MDI9901909.1 glycoside hydrolase family 25 protein [Rhodococcus sp. IEGM 1409]MDV6274816.1 glycoside hydrolase family 25 protein [Rhodococcus erythropolis]MDV8006099.1 glycoside hydrolase family 25 protein [Rhodococcus sp. IEGM 1318]ORI24263.1 glycoside hydrolase [Rhodococcus erythropolis]
MAERRIVRTLGKLTPIAMAAAIAITAPGLAAADAPRGPDVSSWQHVDGTGIDWFQVKASGHEFAMVKATESLNYVNPYFIQDCLVMRAAGVSRGAYHYADVRQSPEAQAAFYSAIVLGINGPGDLPPVLDLEDAKGLPAGQVIDWTHRYLNTVQALTGRQPIIYTYPNFWRTQMANTTEFNHYPLWIADYNGQNAPGPLPGGWSNWTFWQYTSTGRIPGITGNTDINVYSGAQGDFDRYANSVGFGSS